MPLAMTSPGKTVKVVDIAAGRGLSRRLTEMGLTPGVEVKVITNHMPGPVMIQLRGSKVALGHGICQKIRVSEVSK